MTAKAGLGPAETKGDPVLLERLVADLIDNAAGHNVDDGWIRVTTGRRNASVFLEVSNSGSPFPTTPFSRSSSRSSGWRVGVTGWAWVCPSWVR